jgi:hypothetical protein
VKRAGVPADRAKTLATTLRAIFEKYPQHRENVIQRRSLKAEIYKHLVPAVGKKEMVEVAEALIRMARP